MWAPEFPPELLASVITPMLAAGTLAVAVYTVYVVGRRAVGVASGELDLGSTEVPFEVETLRLHYAEHEDWDMVERMTMDIDLSDYPDEDA